MKNTFLSFPDDIALYFKRKFFASTFLLLLSLCLIHPKLISKEKNWWSRATSTTILTWKEVKAAASKKYDVSKKYVEEKTVQAKTKIQTARTRANAITDQAKRNIQSAKKSGVEALVKANDACVDLFAKVPKAWDKSVAFVDRNKEEIVTATVVVGGIVLYALTQEDGANGYQIKDSQFVGEGKGFTQAQKEQILKRNILKNDGVLRSDGDGRILKLPEKYYKGHIPPLNEAQIDHIKPKSLGGTNSFRNAQVLSREENLLKGVKIE